MSTPFAYFPITVNTDHRLSLRQYRVLIALCSWSSEEVWATREQISERCGYKENVITDCIAQLVTLGYVERVQKDGRRAYRKTLGIQVEVPPGIQVPEQLPTPPGIQVGDHPESRCLDHPDSGCTPTVQGINQVEPKNTPVVPKKPKPKPKPSNRIETSPEFEEFWTVYPKRLGSPNRLRAYQVWCQRLVEGYTPEQMIEGAKRYHALCLADGSLGTKYVKQAATFLGPDLHFLEGDIEVEAQRDVALTLFDKFAAQLTNNTH